MSRRTTSAAPEIARGRGTRRALAAAGLGAVLGLAGARAQVPAVTTAGGSGAASTSAGAPAPAPAPAPAAAPVAAQTGLRGDAAHGKVLYQACASCHSIDDNDIGPRHRGVVGRPAASLPDYAYSPALRQSGLIWDEATLDRWLVNPSALVPGTKMFFKIDDSQSRADIIAYLEQQK